MNETTRRFSTAEVAEIAEITARQLDWWCRHGGFGDDKQNPGTGAGRERRFSRRDLIAARTLHVTTQLTVQLLRNGISNDVAAEIARTVRANPNATWLTITPSRVEADPLVDLSTITEPLLLASIAQARTHVDIVLALEPSTERLAHA